MFALTFMANILQDKDRVIALSMIILDVWKGTSHYSLYLIVLTLLLVLVNDICLFKRPFLYEFP